jgi:hypothetical protein
MDEQRAYENIQLLVWLSSIKSRVQEQAGGTWNDDPDFLRVLAMEQQSRRGSLFGTYPHILDYNTVSTESPLLQQLAAPRIPSREPPHQQQSTVSGRPEASLEAQNAAFRLMLPRSTSRSEQGQADVGSDPALRLSTTTTTTMTTPPGRNDVLFGRGVTTNRHGGNRRFRSVIAEHSQKYQAATKQRKTLIAREVVQIIQQRGGRFLQKKESGDWEPVKDAIAREKASQALRDSCRYQPR